MLTRDKLFVSMRDKNMTEREGDLSSKEFDPKRRIVVTGIGMVTPLGLDTKSTWNNLVNGKSGIAPIDIEFTKIKVAGQIKNFDQVSALSEFVLQKNLRRISRPSQLSTAAAIEALRNAGLLNGNKLKDGIDPNRVGVRIGTGIGGANLITGVSERIKAGARVSPFDTLLVEPERVASVVSMSLGLKGPLAMPSAACATGNLAITDGYKDIMFGDADIMLVGGVESTIEQVILNLFDAVGALSHESDPEKAQKASRPFDKTRNGFVMSEGAGILVLEEFEHAKKRGAKILAELIGYGNTADAGDDTAPSGEGAERAIKEAMRKSGGIPPEGLIYINAHATSTPAGDPVEILAIKSVFGGRKELAVSSTKGSTGHLMGGAGGVEAAFSVLALSEGILPPTVNLDSPMDEASGINLVPNEAQKRQPNTAINNGFGFGGFNSVTVFRRVE